MPDTAVTNQGSDLQGYANAVGHVRHELMRLNLLLRLQVLAQWNSQPTSPLDQFKGLVVTDSEIASLFRAMSEAQQNDKPEAADANTAEIEGALGLIESEIEQRRAASFREGVCLPLPHLSKLFGLSRFEEQCLVMCLAPELDRKYEKLYAYLEDDVTRKKPSVDLALMLASGSFEEKLAARLAFQPRSPLLRHKLVRLTDSHSDEGTPLLSRFIKLEDRIVDFLLGTSQMDARLERIASIVRGPFALGDLVLEESQRSVLGIVRAHFEEEPAMRRTLAIHLQGPYGSGKKALAEMAASEIGLPLIVVDARKMMDGSLPFEEVAWIAGREALLQSAMLCFENLDAVADNKDGSCTDLLFEVAKECSWVTFLLGTRPWRPSMTSDDLAFADVHLSAPDDAERIKVWKRLTDPRDVADGVNFGELASKFRFTPGQIRDALATARNDVRWRSDGDRLLTMSDLGKACRAHSSQKLNNLARKIEPTYQWKDIVLPEEVLAQLREVCRRVVYRHRVMGDWGFAKKLSLGKGVNALFAGPSGTGKTMASEIVSRELDLDLYKIDLSGVVSKYIGETEKNLDRIFSAAEDANAILFFDEADALFGKRSEVRDSHDRYANIEISYLLQKMEEYEGLAILATNLKANLDESFTRRLAFTIHFPFPDEADRRRIWGGIWPAQIELDKSVDLNFLAGRFKLSGGNIKNIALAAAFLAASDGGRVTMSHLLHATRREYQKLGKPLGADELMPNVVEEVSL
jgi:AAA+ superfamily predicted ATPase